MAYLISVLSRLLGSAILITLGHALYVSYTELPSFYDETFGATYQERVEHFKAELDREFHLATKSANLTDEQLDALPLEELEELAQFKQRQARASELNVSAPDLGGTDATRTAEAEKRTEQWYGEDAWARLERTGAAWLPAVFVLWIGWAFKIPLDFRSQAAFADAHVPRSKILTSNPSHR